MMIAAAYGGLLLLLGATRSAALGAAMAMVVWGVVEVPAIPDVLVAYGKYAVTWVGHTGELLYVGEGLNSTVAVSRLPNGMLNYHNAGKIQASSQPQDMRLQRLLGHATTLLAEHPGRALVIGCGSGVTAGAVASIGASRASSLSKSSAWCRRWCPPISACRISMCSRIRRFAFASTMRVITW